MRATLLLFLFTISAFAESGTFSTVPSGVAGNATNTTPSETVRIRNDEAFVYTTCSSTNDYSTQNVTFVFAVSPDGTYFTTQRIPAICVTNVANGTGTNTHYGVFNTSGVNYFRLASVENPASGSTNGISNIRVFWGYR